MTTLGVLVLAALAVGLAVAYALERGKRSDAERTRDDAISQATASGAAQLARDRDVRVLEEALHRAHAEIASDPGAAGDYLRRVLEDRARTRTTGAVSDDSPTGKLLRFPRGRG